MHSEDLLSIGDFAALARLSVKALRHYDEQGLLSPVRVDPVTRYRQYSPAQTEVAALIGTMRRMDVPLAVIREVLDAAASPDEAVGLFHRWWLSQERRHKQRQEIGRYVTQRLRHQGDPPMDIRTRAVPERKLAVISKELFQPELDAFIMNSFVALFDFAKARPGLRPIETTEEWPTYVIFHGPVTPDLSALVEVCIVIDGDAQPEGDIVIRMDAAHEEAYARLTRTGIDFPQILDAYSAVAHYAQTHGSMIETMPSREVYLTDVIAAGPDDDVCDVAFPYLPKVS